MQVYHGSYIEIREIDLSLGRTNRDFGIGFYVTNIKDQAQYWATRKGEDHNTKGVITEFEFDEFIWEDKELTLLRFPNYSEEWLDFVVNNRTNRSQKNNHNFDIVEGPVADDAITVRVNDYMRGDVSKQDFLQELKFKKPTHQICFCTVASLQALTYLNSRKEWDIERIANNIVKQIVLDKHVDEITATDLFFSSQTFTLLKAHESQLHTKPWKEIYQLLKAELK